MSRNLTFIVLYIDGTKKGKECKLGLLLDDAYFIVTTESDTYAQIGRDELLEMFGDLETTYVYTGEYDNLGKVYKNRDCGYITVY